MDPDAAFRVASFGEIAPMRQRGLAAVRAGLEAAQLPEAMPEMAAVIDTVIPTAAGGIPVRIYRPDRRFGHTSSHVLPRWRPRDGLQPLVRAVGTRTGVGGRRHRRGRRLPVGPRGPAARTVRRCLRRDRMGRRNATDLGIDDKRLAVVGDSAGGSLAAAVALAARDRSGPAICTQVLMYPGWTAT